MTDAISGAELDPLEFEEVLGNVEVLKRRGVEGHGATAG